MSISQSLPSIQTMPWPEAVSDSHSTPKAISTRAFERTVRRCALKPDLWMVHNNLGIALKAKGNFDEAIAAYQEAIRPQPNDPAPHNNLAITLQAKDNLDGSITAYRTVLRSNPVHWQPDRTQPGNGPKRDTTAAIALYHVAIRLQPDNAESHLRLAIALQRSGDLDGAIGAYRRAIQLQADLAAAHYNLGNSSLIAGRRQEAAQAFREFLLLTPETPDNRGNIAQARARLDELSR